MLLAAPEQTKETRDIIENIKKCSVKEELPEDLANAGGFVNTIRKGSTVPLCPTQELHTGREGWGRGKDRGGWQRETGAREEREGEDLCTYIAPLS